MKEKERKNDKNPENMALDINTDENIAGTTHLNEDLSEESEIEQIKNQLAEQKDKYLRLYAEFDNYKRRNAKEKVELIQTAGKEVIGSLLVVLDDFERAQNQMKASEDVDQVKDGVRLIYNKLRTALQSRGLKEMESIGKEFNPEFHEAISEIPAPSPELKGKVIDEVEKGYYLNDKIIRFAKVVVGK